MNVIEDRDRWAAAQGAAPPAESAGRPAEGAGRPTERGRSPLRAAVMSFFLPGLGQMYGGSVLRGFLLALPQVALLAFVAGFLWRSPLFFGGLLIQYALAIAVLNLVLMAYRAFSVVDAYRIVRGRRPERPGRSRSAIGATVLAVLLLGTVAVHGSLAYVSYETYDNVTSSAFAGNEDPEGGELPPAGRAATPRPGGTPAPSTPGSTTGPVATPSDGSSNPPTDPAGTPAATQPPATSEPGTPYWAENGRLDVLLIGGDAGRGRWSLRTDTMVVASVDYRTGRAALFSIPRNMTNTPLPPDVAGAYGCGCWSGLLNALYVEAGGNPQIYPGGESAGFRAVQGAIEELMQIQIDFLAVVDLTGFVGVIDALGGIDIDVPKAVFDPSYPNEDGRGHRVVRIEPGLQHMDGTTALAYARSREQDSDYARIARQQHVLLALRAKLNPCEILPRLPQLIQSTKDLIRTNVPVEDLPTLLEFAGRVDKVRRFSFTPYQGIATDVSTPGTLEAIRRLAVEGLEPKRPGTAQPSEEPEEPGPSSTC